MDTRMIKLFSDEPELDAKKIFSAKGIKDVEKMVKRYFKEEHPEDGAATIETRKDEETGDFRAIIFHTRRADRDLTTRLDAFMLGSREFKAIRSASEKIAAVGEPPFFIRSGPDELPVNHGEDLLQQFRALGQKGLAIQRYKGLGEMNPDQLWETTMDPTKRVVKKVVLGDRPLHDIENIFSTLMGDVVEPRKAYIEEHALEVQNLDV
jgi:DNA gyrase subunit B